MRSLERLILERKKIAKGKNMQNRNSNAKKSQQGMKIRTNVKAGGLTVNHNQALASDAKNLRVKNGDEAGLDLKRNNVAHQR
jgi:hypothetical protein